MPSVSAEQAADRIQSSTVARTSMSHDRDRKRVVLAIHELLNADPDLEGMCVEQELLSRGWDPMEAESVRYMIFDQQVLRE